MNTKLDIFRPWASNPWKEFSSLQRQMDRLLTEVGMSSAVEGRNEMTFLPACDIEESDKQYSIALDLPGIPKDQIKVELTGNTLTIFGEHQEERKEEKGKCRVYERSQGRFERSFLLPDATKSEKITADYKDGVLKITVPKAEAVQTRQVQVGDGKSAVAVPPQGKAEGKKESKPSEKSAA